MATQYPPDNRHEYEALLKQFYEAEKEKIRLNLELMRSQALLSDAEDLIRRWRTELEIVASKTDHNGCHIWIPDLLKRTLGHTGNFLDPEKLTPEQFAEGCVAYHGDRFGDCGVRLMVVKNRQKFSGKMFNRKAVFLDRDGTLISAIHRPDGPKKITAPFYESELSFASDVHEAFRILKRAGYLRIMITNQPDVANGYMSEDEWQKIHQKVIGQLDLDDWYMCRHTSDDRCQFKKPSPNMLFAAADKWGINLSQSFMIGDTDNDMDAGKAAGCAPILLDRFYNQDINAVYRTINLTQAVTLVTFFNNLRFVRQT